MATHHFIINGFKRNKRNKRYHTLFITTTLKYDDLCAYMRVAKFHHDSIVDVDSFTDNPRSWLKPEFEDIPLTLFDELRIIGMIC